ncbi:MAG: SOS response-associated peptidase family protein [Dokdonella sp.]|uniref:SOS response-associated peptidase family protein n=1 Tax=Dokdonella sp. TaxID=2291710 RepID=UPI003F7F26CE
MCYSAQIIADYLKYVRRFGADVSLTDFYELYWLRSKNPKVKIPRAMDAAFVDETDEVARIRSLMADYYEERERSLQQDLFAQKKRLADAERTLQTKTTKKALEDQRIATSKIEWILGKQDELRRPNLVDEDSRIFPGWYAPVMVWQDGRRVVRPMRYQCRPAGAPAFYDTKFPGTYNARRDNLEGTFWKKLFGYTHGVMVANAFFENVSRHTMEHRELVAGEKEENVVLEFRPQPTQDMLLACVWSEWRGEGESLLSFAAITDEPPPEVAAAGHDRCVIPIKPENVDAWLRADPKDLAAMYAILDDRERPYYEHRLAA